MPETVLTARAEHDIAEVLVYLMGRSERAAVRFRSEFDRACRLLTRSPRLGRDRVDLGVDLRSHVFDGHYALYFRRIDTGIEVSRVVHGIRQVDPSMFDG